MIDKLLTSFIDEIMKKLFNIQLKIDLETTLICILLGLMLFVASILTIDTTIIILLVTFGLLYVIFKTIYGKDNNKFRKITEVITIIFLLPFILALISSYFMLQSILYYCSIFIITIILFIISFYPLCSSMDKKPKIGFGQ